MAFILSKEVKRLTNTIIETTVAYYETVDLGRIFKVNGYELIQECEYSLNGVVYKTDNPGRIVSCQGKPIATPDGESIKLKFL